MNKNLTDDDRFNLGLILSQFGLPDDEVEWSLSKKGQLLNKYLQQRKDFELKTERSVYQLYFSRLQVIHFEHPKPSVSEVTNLEPSKKGRGKAKKPALSRTSLTSLVDSLDVEKLENLASAEDVSVSHLVRLAIKNYLKQIENK